MTQYGYLTIDVSTKTITAIDKTYKGDLVINQKYGETTIEII